MDQVKKEHLEAKGWKVSTVSDFLELAEKMHSSQPRVANAENGDASVSIELLICAMLATGATPQDIGKAISQVR